MDDKDIPRMANQIAGFFKGYGEAEARAEIATHINSFWEPRMRRQLFALLDAKSPALDPLVLAAAPGIKRPADAA